ncbi:Asp-tRNA(Asn)/Glu-tRNA(Gln) amidotransferase subunit GatC [Cyclobacteriaceae bacterium]|nr:Asp-tRNA(Asn)/Glu-tRNA(Gln) amidotransferase subunit GatC [Cyclobacteriaceae bacterium]
MIVNKDTVANIAQLARLELDEKEQSKMQEDMNSVLDWVQKLEEINTDEVEPLIHMSYETNVLRNDEPKQDISHEEALHNAPKKDSNYFRVPKVID